MASVEISDELRRRLGEVRVADLSMSQLGELIFDALKWERERYEAKLAHLQRQIALLRQVERGRRNREAVAAAEGDGE